MVLGPREPRKPYKSIDLDQNKIFTRGILEKMFQKFLGVILAKNLSFFEDLFSWSELSSGFPEIFLRKMGAGNMKNGGGLTSATQNTQELLRSTKTRKVRALRPPIMANCPEIKSPSSTYPASYSK